MNRNRTKSIPSRPLLRYLNEQICTISARPFCHQATPQSSTNSLRRSILLRPSQQCRHIVLSRVIERTQLGKLQSDCHKILDYDTYRSFGRLKAELKSRRILLWREATKRPCTKPHVFLDVMTMEHAIRKYLCKREDAMLDPGIGTSWMLVPRIGYAEHQMFGAHSLHTGEKNLDEYLLVKRKSWMVPKPGTQISAKTGRGGAKLIHLDKGVTGTTLGVMLAKAYFFLEKTSYKVEFHVHFSNDFKYTEKEMLKELMTQKCGLALHPQVIQWQLPMGCNISVRPVSNGRELVWVVGKGRDQSNLVARAKLAMENSMATPVFAISRGREMRKDRILRLAQDEREIARLRKEGRSFAHILERQRDAAIREENLKSMFKNVNLTRRAKKKERDQTRLQNRLAHQKRRLLMLPNRLFQQKEFFRQKDFFYRHLDPREPDSEPGSLYSSRMYREGCQIEREAKRKAFVASRNARKAKKRASFGTGASYLKSAQIRAPKVELRGKSGSGRSFRRVQKSRFKETVRDVAKRELRLRSPRPAVPSVLGIRMNMASTLKGRKCRKEQRKPDLNLPKGRPTSIRSKIEDMV